jgi:dihydroceramidase
MGDDLSMFFAVGTLLHQLLTFDATPSRRRVVTALILGTIIPVSVYHVWTNEIIAHEILFGAMVILCGRKIRWLIKEKIQNEGSQKRLRTLANLGSGTLKSPLAFLPRDAGRLSAVAECSRI